MLARVGWFRRRENVSLRRNKDNLLGPVLSSSDDEQSGLIELVLEPVLPRTRLDDLLARGRKTLHPQLVHFLGNRSYAKALMYLQGDANIPAGVCGGRAGRPKEG